MNTLPLQLGESQVAGFVLVLGRLSPLFVLAPLFSSKMIPVRARGVICVGLAIGLAPLATKGQHVPLDSLGLGGLMIKEILVGLAFAFTVSLLFAALSVAGSFLDTLSGFAYGSLVDPITGTQSSVLSQLYAIVGVLVFIAINGDAWLIEGIARTYKLVPLLEFPSISSLVGGIQHAFVGIFAAALQIAAPVMLALLVTDAAFGVVSRVVPQMNVFAVALPAKVVVCLLMIAVSLPFVGSYISDELQRSVSSALQMLKVA